MQFEIGMKVFDRATQRWATIVDTCLVDKDVDDPFMIYILDDSIPDDEDFPHRQRLDFEISLTETKPLDRVWSLSPSGDFTPVKSN